MPFGVEILVEMLAVGGVPCPGRGMRGRGGVPTALCLLTLTARVRTDHLGHHVHERFEPSRVRTFRSPGEPELILFGMPGRWLDVHHLTRPFRTCLWPQRTAG